MTATTPKRRPARQDPEETRLRLLEAGRELLLQQGPDERIDVRLKHACDHAGYTTGAAYSLWDNQSRYQEELARYVASNFDWAGPESIAEELVEIVGTTDDYVEAIRRSAVIYFERFVGQDDFFLALRFWSVREPSTQLEAALVDGYRVVHDGFVELFASLMEHYQLRMRSPTTLDDMTIILTALVEGLALRHRIVPEAVERAVTGPDGASSSLFAEGMIAIVQRHTEPVPGHDLES